MRRIVLALVVAVIGSARFASGAAISVAGAECGTPPLDQLSFSTQATSNLSLVVNGSIACPEGTDLGGFGFGALLDGNGSPLYGPSITSLDLTITGVDPQVLTLLTSDDVTLKTGLAFTSIEYLGDNVFRLFGGPGIQIQCSTDPAALSCTPTDALILFDSFPSTATIAVTAVNPVPEPATGALLLSGLGAALVRRARRRRT